MKFSSYRLLFIILSLVFGLGLYAYLFGVQKGFARSISFDGGIRISILLPQNMGKEELEAAARKAGFKDPVVRLTNIRANQFDLELGPDVRDRIKKELEALPEEEKKDRNVAHEIEEILLRSMPEITAADIVSRETISASYGSDLFRVAVWSFIWTVLVIGLYLSFRFDFPYALGASLALVHDIILTIGFIGVAQIEPSVPVVAAVLTIVGYSINDTIVIFDRIRDTMGESVLTPEALRSTMDEAITRTLSRTILTSLLTLISVVALLLGGADSLMDFAWVLIFGIVVGTYSSIFIASHFVQYYMELLMARFRR